MIYLLDKSMHVCSKFLGVEKNIFTFTQAYTFLNLDNPLQQGSPGGIKVAEFEHTPTHSHSLSAKHVESIDASMAFNSWTAAIPGQAYNFLNLDNPLQQGNPGRIKVAKFEHTSTHSRSLRAKHDKMHSHFEL